MVFGVIWLSNQQSAEMLWFASQMNRVAVVGWGASQTNLLLSEYSSASHCRSESRSAMTQYEQHAVTMLQHLD